MDEIDRGTGVDMTDAFDITEKSLLDTMTNSKTIIESNYFLNYNYEIYFEPKDGYSFASDFNKNNISITTPTAFNIDGTNKSYISVDNSIMASFHFNTRPTQIKATSVSEYWYDWMTESEMANITFTTNDSEHPTVCIDTQGGYTNWGDIVGGCCDASGNLKKEYLSGSLNFQVRFGEKYYGESYTDWMNVTSAKITLFGEGYSSKLLTLEMSFTDGDKDYVLKYDAHKITYYEPKEQGSSEWKVMTEDLVTPTENSSKTNSIPNYAPSGKEFVGNWTTTANGSTPYSFGSLLTANVKLYPICGVYG